MFLQNTITWDMTLFSLVDLYNLYWSLTSGQYALKFKGFFLFSAVHFSQIQCSVMGSMIGLSLFQGHS